MRLYAKYGVQYAWLVDPAIQTLEAYQLDSNSEWQVLGFFRDNEKVNVVPVDAITFILSDFWG